MTLALLNRLRLFLFPPLAILLLADCARDGKWNMMPTPAVHQLLGESAFTPVSKGSQTPETSVFYATNRPGTGATGDRRYGNGIVDFLQFGTTTVRFGNRRMKWRDLLDFSTRRRKQKIPVHLENSTELAAIPGSSGDNIARAIDRVLATKKDKEITIYVHGANSTFFLSNVQAAQFHHFMAHAGAMVAFSWPSTGNLFTYRKDVRFAALSVPRFADLVEFLAERTCATKINILAYSAGAQVASPGLALLRQRHPDDSAASLRRKLRIGQVYFTAPDGPRRKRHRLPAERRAPGASGRHRHGLFPGQAPLRLQGPRQLVFQRMGQQRRDHPAHLPQTSIPTGSETKTRLRNLVFPPGLPRHPASNHRGREE